MQVTRLRGKAVLDEFSGETVDTNWTNPNRLVVRNVAMAPSVSFQFQGITVNSYSSEWTLYCMGNKVPDIKINDRVIFGGLVYNVDTYPIEHRSPFSRSKAGRLAGVTYGLSVVGEENG